MTTKITDGVVLSNLRNCINLVPIKNFNFVTLHFNSEDSTLKVYEADLNESFIVSMKYNIPEEVFLESSEEFVLPLIRNISKHLINPKFTEMVLDIGGIELKSNNLNLNISSIENPLGDEYPEFPVDAQEFKTLLDEQAENTSTSIDFKITKDDISEILSSLSVLASDLDSYTLTSKPGRIEIETKDAAKNKVQYIINCDNSAKLKVKFDEYFTFFLQSLLRVKDIDVFDIQLNSHAIIATFKVQDVEILYSVVSYS